MSEPKYRTDYPDNSMAGSRIEARFDGSCGLIHGVLELDASCPDAPELILRLDNGNSRFIELIEEWRVLD